jgi:hypothetical protein
MISFWCMKKFIEQAKAALSAIANSSNKGPQHLAQIATVGALSEAQQAIEGIAQRTGENQNQITALENRIAALEQKPAPAPSEATA